MGEGFFSVLVRFPVVGLAREEGGGASWLESSREVLHGGQRYPVDGLVPRYRANGEGSFCYLLGKHHGHDGGETSGN